MTEGIPKIHSTYSWIENKKNKNGKDVHRHEDYPYWHDVSQDHTKEGSKRSKQEREKISQSPTQHREESKQSKESKDKENRQSEQAKRDKKEQERHKNYTLVNHKKYTSLKQKLMQRPYASSGFKIPKFTPSWCVMTALSVFAQLIDASEELYDKYSKSPHSKGGKILQYQSNGYEDAMDRLDKIIPPDKKEWTFEEVKTADVLFSKQIKSIYQSVADKYGMESWQDGYRFLNNSEEYKNALKTDAPYLYRVRQEAYTLGRLRQALRQGELVTQKYQREQAKRNPIPTMNRQQATRNLKTH